VNFSRASSYGRPRQWSREAPHSRGSPLLPAPRHHRSDRQPYRRLARCHYWPPFPQSCRPMGPANDGPLRRFDHGQHDSIQHLANNCQAWLQCAEGQSGQPYGAFLETTVLERGLYFLGRRHELRTCSTSSFTSSLASKTSASTCGVPVRQLSLGTEVHRELGNQVLQEHNHACSSRATTISIRLRCRPGARSGARPAAHPV